MVQVLDIQTQKSPTPKDVGLFWQGHKDLNPGPTVLETAALPTELYPYVNIKGVAARIFCGGPSGIRTRDYPVMSRRL